MDRPGLRQSSFIVMFVLLTATVFKCQATGKPKFCGKALNDVLDLVCVHGFYPRIKRFYKMKKDINSEIHEFLKSLPQYVRKLVDDGKDMKDADSSFMQNQSASGWHRHRRHRRLGIVHDCCRSGCVYTDIVKYCL